LIFASHFCRSLSQDTPLNPDVLRMWADAFASFASAWLPKIQPPIIVS
jgi:hypothetical protein